MRILILAISALSLLTVQGLLAQAATKHAAGVRDERSTLHRVVLRGQRFLPARIVAMVGDSIRFELESGAPHNVSFNPDSIPPGALAPLAKNLGTEPRWLFTPEMLLNPGESVVLSLANLPPGTYLFYCAPHVGGGMRGELVLRSRE